MYAQVPCPMTVRATPTAAACRRSLHARAALRRAAELKEITQQSLELFKQAVYDPRFPALFSLDIYASMIGMFELNDLGGRRLGPASSALG